MSAPWLRRVLGLAPREFRERYAEELAIHVEREREAAARGRRISFQVRELWGALLLVGRLRLGIVREADSSGVDAPRWIAARRGVAGPALRRA